MTISPIDYEHLRQFSHGDAGLEAELLGLLRAQIETLTPQLTPDASAEAWAAVAHTLKGASRGVGAVALGDACEAAEKSTDKGLAERQGALASVVFAADDVLAHIEDVTADTAQASDNEEGAPIGRDAPPLQQGAARP